MKKRKPLTLEELSEDTQKVFEVLNEGSDLACVLIGASYLDELLASTLRATFAEVPAAEELLRPGGPVGSFATRADLAYCLNLVTESSHRDVRTIGRIRNQFAHKHFALSFGDPEIRSACEQLRAWRFLANGEEEVVDALTPGQLRTRARNLFTLSAVFLGQRIHVDAFGHRRKRQE